MSFNKPLGPNVTSNPLPNHASPKINAISEDSGWRCKERVDEVKTPMVSVYEALVKGGILQSKVKEGEKNSEEQLEEMQKCFCDYHASYVGHVVQDCEEFRRDRVF